jgi:outer membrane receptor protein involved in Fe transport
MGDVPYAAVDRIEMVRGPVSALYGRGGIAGAINYLTLSPSGNDARARASVGSDTFLNGDLRLGRAAGRHQFLVALNGTYSEGWREQNDRKIANVFAKDTVRLGSSAALTLWANYLDKDTATGSVIPLRADGTRLPTIGGREGFFGTGDIGQQRRLFWSAARFEQSPSSGVSWSATAHYRRLAQNGRFDFYDPFGFRESEGIVTLNGFENESLEHTAFVEGQAIVGRLGPARIVAGANYERVTVDEDEFWTGQFGFTFECGFAFFAVEFDAATGRILNRDHPCFVERLLRASSEATNQFASGFAQAEIALGARATVTLGGRYDRFSRNVDITAGTPLFDNLPFDRTLDNFSPKAALSVSYAPNQYAYASFGEGFNSNFGPVWQWDPSLYIRREQPTTLRNYEGGVKGMLLANRLSYALSVYAIRQKDRLVFTTNPAAETDFTAPPNIATTGQRYHTEGLELTMRARPARRTIVDGSYGYTRAKWEELIIETFGPPIDLSGRNAVGVPAHAVSLGVDQQLTDALSARLWWEYYGDYFYTQDNQFKGGQYDLFNLGVTWRPRAWGVSQVNLSVTNLLDEEYYFLFGSRDAPTYAVPGVPIQARVSVDWQF